MGFLQRTELVLGSEALEKLKNSRVAVFGIGGVGGYAVEALVRGGVGKLTLVDGDTIAESNINRQIIALHSTIGEYKAETAKKRALDINPGAKITAYNGFYSADVASDFDFAEFDYIVDAIDRVTDKLEIITRAKAAGVPVISCMGAGNKLDPTKFEVADIYKTSVCPLARVMRAELKKRGVESLKVVYSKEPPVKTEQRTPGSVSFVPSVAGLIIAGEVIKDLIK